MTIFKYKTRGQSPVQGKAKVYFCCHPQDFELYFDEIAEDILSKKNCSIWYSTYQIAKVDEEYFDGLRQMQMFVMPITNKLLCAPNFAIETDFEFAVKNNIPILPILLEKDLDRIFQEKCGDIQYVDKYTDDQTALDYGTKLEKFLSRILLDDDMSERVRNSFSGYVFLSYRKKDRKYAQELMRIIHKNHLYRDVAIWYDEFLELGENFNFGIESALRKSKLFILAVTPNLLEDGNYVMREEYPYAVRSNKTVLPIEMVSTSREVLEEKYKDIPSCVIPNNKDFETILNSYSSDFDASENETSEHQYLMGLAYLKGIDVEIDHSRAFSLIEAAAKAGNEEAMKMLVHMYQKGDGIERDYEKAIAWLEEVSESAWSKFEESKDEDTTIDCLLSWLEISDAWGAFGDYERAFDLTRCAHEVLETMIEDSLKGAYLYTITAMRLASLSMGIGDYDKSEEYYKAILEVDRKWFEDFFDNEADLKFNLYLIEATLKYCRVLIHQDKTEQATKYSDGIHGTLQALIATVKKSSTENNWIKCCSLFVSNCLLQGDLLVKHFHYEDAISVFSEALDVSADLYLSTRTDEYLRLQSKLNLRIADVFLKKQNAEAALQAVESAKDIAAVLSEKTRAYDDCYTLAQIYIQIGEICKIKKTYAESLKAFQKARDLIEQLSKHRENRTLDQTLAKVYRLLGDAYLLEERYDESLKYCIDALSLYKDKVCNDDDIFTTKNLCAYIEAVGDVYYAMEDEKTALEYYYQILDLRKHICESDNSEENLSYLGNILFRIGVLKEDREIVQASLEIWEKLHSLHPDVELFTEKINYINSIIDDF